MARARKIYVVRRYGFLLGAFTVKHEMYEFAERIGWYDEPGVMVTEVPDGLVRVSTFKSYPLERQ